jgi:hypothetical protein
MSKRYPNKFPNADKDFWRTPANAVKPLLPFLNGVRTFAEPCCGEGDLVRHLEAAGLTCVYKGDLRYGQDALALDDYNDPDGVITNPPFSKASTKVFIRMIWHFPKIAPTWLLLPLDVASNQYAASFLPTCTDIVPIGRVRWIAGTKNDSTDNFAWYKFELGHVGGPVFHPWGHAPSGPIQRSCEQCRRSYQALRAESRYCSSACRQKAYRYRLGVTQA